jgi:hypothetical protein
MPLRLLPGVILAKSTGKSQLTDAGTAGEPGMSINALCLTGILIPVRIPVQESFGTGMGTYTKFGRSTGDWYFYQNCHKYWQRYKCGEPENQYRELVTSTLDRNKEQAETGKQC